MQRKPNIRWRKSDSEKLVNTVKKFNAKIEYHKKAHPDLKNILPDKVSVKDFKSSIGTRQDFNRELRSLERFLVRGAEKPIKSKTGNKVTVWEKREIGIKVATINRERSRERKRLSDMPVTSRGEDTGLKRGEMKSERMISLEPKKFNFNKIKGGKEWELFKENINRLVSDKYRMEQNESYKENYIKALQNIFGNYADEVIRAIEKIPADQVVDIFFSEQEASIDFIYDPIEMMGKLSIVSDIWKNASNR